jgi:hypothetical protein
MSEVIHNGLGWASDADRLIYIGIPKTGSCSMREVIGVNISGKNIDMYNLSEDRKSYRKFTVIREPFRRFVSAVYEGLKRPETPRKIKNLNSIKNVPELINEYLTILETDGFIEVHTVPQICFIKNKEGGFFNIDKILIFENLSADFKEMCNELGLEKRLNNRNVGDRGKSNKALEIILKNPKIKKRIQKLYKEDFEFYNKIKKEKDESKTK